MREKPKADETNNYAYNKRLQPFASNLRKKMTRSGCPVRPLRPRQRGTCRMHNINKGLMVIIDSLT